MAGPIKPSAVVAAKQASIPNQVFKAFNKLIVEYWDGSSALIKQSEVIKLILREFEDDESVTTRRTIFDNHWLDVEEIYRAEGWLVVYDKPGYNECYEPTFTFSC